MVSVKNEDLRNVYYYLKTVENTLNKEIKQVIGNKSHLDKLVPSNLAKEFSSNQKTALAFVDNMTQVSYDGSVVILVSTFEKILFAKYRTTYGALKIVVRDQSPRTIDYYHIREKFINDKIDWLSGIINLIEGKIDNDLLIKLNLIKDHRNYIAHGKRDVASPTRELKLDELVVILDNVILEIEK